MNKPLRPPTGLGSWPRDEGQEELTRSRRDTVFTEHQETRRRSGQLAVARARRHRRNRLAMTISTLGLAIAVALGFVVWTKVQQGEAGLPRTTLPVRPDSYIGVYQSGAPQLYSGVTNFTTQTGIKPRLVSYYSGWFEPFKEHFALMAARHGAVPLVQINPDRISLAAIASGHYDSYLRSYAEAVRSYGRPVILGFAHEMNGDWYSWGYRHSSPAQFVAAWRHIVTLFRHARARNVTWLWTVNVMHSGGGIASPVPWWPGNKYVTWVGMDGYYYKPSWKFASLFGPTIAAVRELTHDPILIAETSVSPTANQPAKINDLFAGIRLYGLLGFVWFDSIHNLDWRLSNPSAIDAFRKGAGAYHRSAS
jgi:mannan endo-1,4-beta-mannosidase